MFGFGYSNLVFTSDKSGGDLAAMKKGLTGHV
jgi:hypothetical protein